MAVDEIPGADGESVAPTVVSDPPVQASYGPRPGIDELLFFPPPDGPLDVARAHDLVLAAEEGNPVAETSLGRLVFMCNVSLGSFPTPTEFEETRANWEAWNSDPAGALNWNNMRKDLETCWALADVMDLDAMTATALFARAARQGYGPALAELAVQQMQFNSRVVDGETEVDSDEPGARVLFNAAMRTRHPDALFRIGQFHRNSELFPVRRSDNGMEWILAACHFGMDCETESDWLRAYCRMQNDCGRPYARTLLDYVEYNMFTGREIELARQNAPELISLLESAEWERLDLRMPGDPPLDDVLSAMEEGS